MVSNVYSDNVNIIEAEALLFGIQPVVFILTKKDIVLVSVIKQLILQPGLHLAVIIYCWA